ncbi:MAG TPA: amidohydrolase family protein [Acidimicrobiales bacterium]|nr:amidohydrolase family protein [Acidimicrobiales bacterium]
MTTGPIVDMHVHVMATSPDPLRDDYEIWEYGDLAGVDQCEAPGLIEDVEAAMARGGADHFVTVNMYVPEVDLALLGESQPGVAIDDLRSQLPDRLRAFNRWGLSLAATRRSMTLFAAVDPAVLGGRAGAEHLRWAVEHGARGVKVHPVAQRFHPDDPRMAPIYEVCDETGITFLSHAGSSRGPVEFAEPAAFAGVASRHPRMKIVLAHLGGARWEQALELARSFPNVYFDLCEIIAWTGAPHAPSRDELALLIKEIGSDRVFFGTDYPWYEVDKTVQLVLDLPALSEEERWGILGSNAVTRLGLPVDL